MDVIYKIRHKTTKKFYSKSLSESGTSQTAKGGDVYVSKHFAEQRIKKLSRWNTDNWELAKFTLTEITEDND